MKRNQGRIVIAILFFGSLILGCAQQQPTAQPDTRAADEAAIRKLDTDWSNVFRPLAAVSRR
jgi:hypothetical protein